MNGSGTFRIVSERAGFLKLQADWERLFDANPRHSPFLAWGWVDAWLRHIAKDHELQVVTWEDDEGVVQFILPLHRLSNSRDVVLVCSYGADCSDHLGCICSPDLEGRSAELTADAIARYFDRGERVSFGFLDGTVTYHTELRAALEASNRSVRVRQAAPCPAAELPASWDEYLGRMSSNFRSQVRRAYRKISGADQPEFQSVDPSHAASFASDLIRLNRSRLQSKGDTSSLEQAHFREFLADVVPYMAKRGLAWMDSIVLDDEVLACALNLVHGRTVSFYMGGFDDNASRYRPGNALFAHVIQRAIDLGCDRYDFLRGDEPYKYRWSAVDAMTHSVVVYPRGLLRGRGAAVFDDVWLHTRNRLKSLRNKLRGSH